MSGNRNACPHAVGATISHAAGAMASVATIAVSAVIITRCANMLKETLFNDDNHENNPTYLNKNKNSSSEQDANQQIKNSTKRRGWYVLTGSYTQSCQADPFIGVNGDSSGVPYDESKIGRGLSALWIDGTTGMLEHVEVEGGDMLANQGQNINPSYLAIHPNGKVVYACNEVQSFLGQEGTGGVTAFEIIEKTGCLSFRFIGASVSHGGSPCMAVVDRTATVLLVANYMGGNIAMIPLGANGSPRGDTAICHQHFGQGVDVQGRQEAPHAHSVVLDSSQSTLLVCDLGNDQVYPYSIDGSAFSLYPATSPLKLTKELLKTSDETKEINCSIEKEVENEDDNKKKGNGSDIEKEDRKDKKLSAGYGPRHCVIHPNGKVCFVICEMSSLILCFEYFSSGSSIPMSGSSASMYPSSFIMPTAEEISNSYSQLSPSETHIQSPTLHVQQNTSQVTSSGGGLGFWSFVSLANGLRASDTSTSSSGEQCPVNTQVATTPVSPLVGDPITQMDGLTSTSGRVPAGAVTSLIESVDSSVDDVNLKTSSTSSSHSRKINLSSSDSSHEGASIRGAGSGCFGKLLGSYNLLPEDWEDAQGPGKGGKFEKFNNGKWAADLILSPSGKFLYATNRLLDTIVCFSVASPCFSNEAPPLVYVASTPCGGQTPRNVTMSPDGSFLLVAHQHSHSVSSFSVDQSTGSLKIVNTVESPNVSCVKFI